MVSVLLAFSLSIDSFGIGITYGVRKIKTTVGAKLIISLMSVLFTSAALFLGSAVLKVLPPEIANLLGSVLLGAFGIFVIFSTLFKRPEEFDENKSKNIEPREALFLGAALSVDSFGAGISSAILGIGSVFIPILVGICQFVFLTAGVELGKKLGSLGNISERFFSIISGALLVIISVVKLFL